MPYLMVGILGIAAWFFLRSQSPNDGQTPQAVAANQAQLDVTAHAMISAGAPTYDQIKTFQHFWNMVVSDPQSRLIESGVWDSATETAFAAYTGVHLSAPAALPPASGANAGLPQFPLSGASPYEPSAGPSYGPSYAPPTYGGPSPSGGGGLASPNSTLGVRASAPAPAGSPQAAQPSYPAKAQASPAAQPTPVAILQPFRR